jgi:uncharacterized protein
MPVKPNMSWMKTSIVLLVLVLAVLMMTAGCTQTPATPPNTTVATTVATPLPTTVIVTTAPPTSNASGMANPASVYCGQIGGTTVIKTNNTTGGQYGVCNFPNGTSVDEWQLFYAAHGVNTTSNTTTNTTNATKNVTANLTAIKTAVNGTNSTVK